MSWNVEVFVDYREKYIKEYFEKNREYDSIVSVKNLEIGDIASHPIQLEENLWAVIRYEELLIVQAYSEEHLNDLALQNLDDLVKNARARVMIKRNLSSEDIAVVEDHIRVE